MIYYALVIREVKRLIRLAEEQLEKRKHPDPYVGM